MIKNHKKSCEQYRSLYYPQPYSYINKPAKGLLHILSIHYGNHYHVNDFVHRTTHL
jgi:hypothetical protein